MNWGVHVIIIAMIWYSYKLSRPIIHEYYFYKSHRWAMDLDSGTDVYLAKELVQYYAMSIGRAKLTCLTGYSITCLILLSMYVRGVSKFIAGFLSGLGAGI